MESREPAGSLWCREKRSVWLSGLGCVLLIAVEPLYARDFYFTPESLEGSESSSQISDLALFSNPKAQLPGKYPAHISLNKQIIDEHSVSCINTPDGSLEAVLTPALLRGWGVKVDDYPELAKLAADSPLPHALGWYIPAASAHFDFSSQTLALSLPQVAVNASSAGTIDASRWDDGVPVLFSNYAFSGHQSTGRSTQTDGSQYLNLRSGANLGGWRLRNYSAWDHSGQTGGWQTIASWLQHDIHTLKAQFVAGQNSTKGEVFDSILYTGVNVASDEEMLPSGERGFAPVIRGTAASNATVTVKQNGYVIYQSNVPPGVFEIRDLYPSSNSGDMEVIIKEADGSEHSFTQPFASIALMERPEHLRFEATAGRYRADSGSDESEPLFVQSSAIYGVNNRFTIYGGATIAENYLSAMSGAGLNLGQFGSLSADVSAAHTDTDVGKSYDGQSLRLLYSSNIAATQTQFTLAGYRYSTQGYYSFADANRLSHQNTDDDWRDDYNKRTRLQLSVNQPLGEGTIYLSGYQQSYWGTSRQERSLSAGGSFQYQSISYHLNLSWSDTRDGDSDRTLSVGVSLPLNDWLAGSRVNYSVSNNKNGATSQNLGLSGVLLDDNSLSYSAQQSHDSESRNSSSFASTWRTPWSTLDAGYYSSSDHSQQWSYGISGGIVAHSRGVTLSQPLGDQFAIVNADGASGLKFQNQYGVSTDWWGNAIIPSVAAYQENRIGLDTTRLPDDVDSSDTAVIVIPSRNAAVNAHFASHIGYRVLLTLTQADGKLVPFGALAHTQDQQNSGIVDDRGVLYLSGLADKALVEVSWGTEANQHCAAHVALMPESPPPNPANIRMLNVLCQ